MTRQSIASLTQEPNAEVHGVFRACSPAYRVARNQKPYQYIRLVDVTGQMNSYAWLNNNIGSYSPKENDIIRIVGKTRLCPTDNSVVVNIRDVEAVPRTQENPIAVLPVCTSADRNDIDELIQVMDDISSKSLKEFLHQVFADDRLAMTFVTGQASLNHHHANKGGLLRHSLDCARMIKQYKKELPDHELEIGVVAGLLHDISKTAAFYNVGAPTLPMINHDARTLEILAEPLRKLERNWSDGAGLLRMALEFPLTKKEYLSRRYHVPVIVNIIWHADQVSTALDLERSSFASEPATKKFTKNGDMTYWRPSADNYHGKAAA